jgi:hypothetical protein
LQQQHLQQQIRQPFAWQQQQQHRRRRLAQAPRAVLAPPEASLAKGGPGAEYGNGSVAKVPVQNIRNFCIIA